MAVRKFLLVLGVLAVVPAMAGAAGFGFFENGGKGMGMAGAFTATADDPSAMFYNPAGLAFQKGDALLLGGTLVIPSYKFTGANPYPGQGVTENGKRNIFLTPGLYYRRSLNENISYGVGTFLPFGLGTEWENPTSYTGRYISKKADLKSLSIQPTIAYKVNDNLGIGFGIDIRLSKVELHRDQPFLNPFTGTVLDIASIDLISKWKVKPGFAFGVLAKPMENVRFGFSYRHSVKADFTGTATFTFNTTGNAALDALLKRNVPVGDHPVETSITFPKELSIGVATTLIEKTPIEFDVNWTGWDSFDLLTLNITDLHASTPIPEYYKNVFNWRIGVERQLNEQLAIRGGYIFDETPQPVEGAGPLLPDSNRHGINIGAGYKMGNWSMDVAALILLFETRSTVVNGVPTNLNKYDGEYKNHATLLGFSLGYAF